MAYGDGHAEQTARDIAEILRKSRIQQQARERELAGSRYNEGLHRAIMVVHAIKTRPTMSEDEIKLLNEVVRALEQAKVSA